MSQTTILIIFHVFSSSFLILPTFLFHTQQSSICIIRKLRSETPLHTGQLFNQNSHLTLLRLLLMILENTSCPSKTSSVSLPTCWRNSIQEMHRLLYVVLQLFRRAPSFLIRIVALLFGRPTLTTVAEVTKALIIASCHACHL